jgi:hypothetical protein
MCFLGHDALVANYAWCWEFLFAKEHFALYCADVGTGNQIFVETTFLYDQISAVSRESKSNLSRSTKSAWARSLLKNLLTSFV